MVSPAKAPLGDDRHGGGSQACQDQEAEVHEEIKSAFQVHIYSILPEEQLEAATTFLGARWAFYNPGQQLPEIFRGSHQPALF